ncbi:MAG: hypothetical protein ACREIA_01645, partial [Opitutaceae bacterium]
MQPLGPGARLLIFPCLFPGETEEWKLAISNDGAAAADVSFLALASNGRKLQQTPVAPLPAGSSREWAAGSLFQPNVMDELTAIAAVSNRDIRGHQTFDSPHRDLARLSALTTPSRQCTIPI